MKTQSSDIQIYVACLAAYNNGILHGAWIDATQSVNDIWDGIKDVLATSPIPQAEEHAIHDYEGFYRISLEEYEDIKAVADIASFINEHGELGAELISHYGDLKSAEKALSDCYAGRYESLSDFAQSITEDTVEVPKSLEFYIDYDRMAQDMAINDVMAIELAYDEVHVFWNH